MQGTRLVGAKKTIKINYYPTETNSLQFAKNTYEFSPVYYSGDMTIMRRDVVITPQTIEDELLAESDSEIQSQTLIT